MFQPRIAPLFWAAFNARHAESPALPCILDI